HLPLTHFPYTTLFRSTKQITFWHIQETGSGPELIQQAVDRFMADNPDVEVEVVIMQNDPYKTRIRTAMGAGDTPCVFMSWGGGPDRKSTRLNSSHVKI